MNKKLKIAALFTAAFLLLTLLAAKVDVRPIGPEGSEVGLAAVNGLVNRILGFRTGWYMLSQVAGFAGILLAFLHGLLGLVQLIKRKKLFAVDHEILVLGGLYLMVFILYVFFNRYALNYRPVILETELESSYPSSHTMLGVCIFLSAAMLELRENRQKLMADALHRGESGAMEAFARLPEAAVTISVRCYVVLSAVLVLSRFLSGVHWFTDIVGSLLLSPALLCWFDLAMDRFCPVVKKQ